MMHVFKDQLQTDRVLCSQVTLRLTLARAGGTGTAIDIDGTYFYYSGIGSSVLAGKAQRSNGTAVFSKSFGCTNPICNTVSADADGNAFIGGAFNSSIALDNGTVSATYSSYWEMFAARLDESSGASFKTDNSENDEIPVSEHSDGNRFFARIYPNPTAGTLQIRYGGTADGEQMTAQLINTIGSVVQTHRFTTTSDRSAVMELNPNLANGVYLLKIDAGKEQIFHKVTLAR